MPDMMKRMLSTREASAYLSLAESTLEKLRLTSHGPRFSKLGRAVRYSVSDLDSWADARQRTSTSVAA